GTDGVRADRAAGRHHHRRDRRPVFSLAAGEVLPMSMTARFLAWILADHGPAKGGHYVRITVAVIILATTGSAAPPQRIVSLIPAVTEMLFAIGDSQRIVG